MNFGKIIKFNLLYCLILTPTLTLAPQLSPNSKRHPHIKNRICTVEYRLLLLFIFATKIKPAMS